MIRPIALRVASISVALLICVACSSSDPTSDDGDPFDGDAHEFLAAWNTLRCEKYLRCDFGFTSTNELGFRAIASTQDCLDRNEDVRFDPATERRLAAGRIVLDRAAAGRCLHSYAGVCVGGVSDSACTGFFDGAVPVGEACDSGSECVSGWCSATSSQCGVCEPVLELGDECTVSGSLHCPRGSTCTTTATEGLRCVATFTGSPVRQVGHGAACTQDALGAEVRYCAPEDYCGVGNTCQSRSEVGSTCNPSFDPCVLDAVCVDDGSGVSRCLAAVASTSLGATCGRVGSDFVVCDYATGLACGPASTCVAIAGDGSLGSPCVDDSQCDSLICDDLPQPGACVAPGLAEGDPCGADEQCPSGRCERPNGVDFVCVPSLCL